MLAVLCGSLLIIRLSAEISQARWCALSDEEQQRLASPKSWLIRFQQLGNTASSLGETASSLGSGLGGMAKQFKPSGKSGVSGKKWVRSDTEATPEPKPTPKPEESSAPLPED